MTNSFSWCLSLISAPLPSSLVIGDNGWSQMYIHGNQHMLSLGNTHTYLNGRMTQAGYEVTQLHSSFPRMTKQSYYFYGNHFCCIGGVFCVCDAVRGWWDCCLSYTTVLVALLLYVIITILCHYYGVCVCVLLSCWLSDCWDVCSDTSCVSVCVAVMWCSSDSRHVFLWRKGEPAASCLLTSSRVGCVPGWNKNPSTQSLHSFTSWINHWKINSSDRFSIFLSNFDMRHIIALRYRKSLDCHKLINQY